MQLEQAIRAVFDSWMGERAVAYRRINHIPDDWGTAVNVQQMVFGNKGDTSGSGVAFSRDEVTGAPRAVGRLPGQRAGRGRGVGRAQHARHRRAGRLAARRAPRAAGDPAHAGGATTATCRTASSPWRRGVCTCCRRATPSARRRRRCASPSTRSARGCCRQGAGDRDDRRRASSTRCCIRRSTRTPRYEVLAQRRGGVAGGGQGRDRVHRRRGGGARPGGRGRDPRAAVHRGRRRGGLPCGAGDPHLRGRQGVAMRRWWRAGWACRRSRAPARWRSTCRRARRASTARC